MRRQRGLQRETVGRLRGERSGEQQKQSGDDARVNAFTLLLERRPVEVRAQQLALRLQGGLGGFKRGERIAVRLLERFRRGGFGATALF